MGSNPKLSDALAGGAMENWVLQSKSMPSERLLLRTVPHLVEQSYSVSSDAFTGGTNTTELTGSTSEVSDNAKLATALTAIIGSKSNPSEILTGGHGPAYDARLTVSDTLIAGADVANFVQHSQSMYSETLAGGHGPHMGSNPKLSDALAGGAMENWVLQSKSMLSETFGSAITMV